MLGHAKPLDQRTSTSKQAAAKSHRIMNWSNLLTALVVVFSLSVAIYTLQMPDMSDGTGTTLPITGQPNAAVVLPSGFHLIKVDGSAVSPQSLDRISDTLWLDQTPFGQYWVNQQANGQWVAVPDGKNQPFAQVVP